MKTKEKLEDPFLALLAVVSEEMPTIEFKGQSFKIRPLAAADLQLAIALARADAEEKMKTFPDSIKSQPADSDQIERWMAVFNEAGEEVAERFGLSKCKTQYDLESCIFTISNFINYQSALSLVYADGSNPPSNVVSAMARLIGTNKEFAAKIKAATITDSVPNAEAQ